MTNTELVELDLVWPYILFHMGLNIMDIIILYDARLRETMSRVENTQVQYYVFALWGLRTAWQSQLQSGFQTFYFLSVQL